MGLSRSDVLKFRAVLPTETVEVPEWGGSVVVRGLSAGGRDQFELALKESREEEGGLSDVRARLVALTAVDDDGKLLFKEGDVEDLSAISAKPMDRLFDVASRLSGMGPKDVEEMEKN